MEVNLNIVSCRGSVFAPRVDYGPENWKKLHSSFPDYMPIQERNSGMVINIGNEQVVVGGLLWTLSSKEKNMDINFFDGKIDVVKKNIKNPISIDNLKALSNEVGEVIDKLMTSLQLVSSRVAFAPTLISEDLNSAITFARKMFRETTYKDTKLGNCNFSNVYRVIYPIGGKQTTVNHLATFSVEQIPFLSSNRFIVKDGFKTDLDINTLPESSLSFSNDDIKDFFSKSADMANDYINFFFSE
jgi:hypothetical protein